jgi:para-aminobenzoate synthetase / 4-amino-4-deoxychorismate lyase
MKNWCKQNSAIIFDTVKRKWLFFQNPREVISAYCPKDVEPVLSTVDELVLKKNYFAAGFVAYEAASAFDSALAVKRCQDFPLAWFGLYEKAEDIDIESPVVEPVSMKPTLSNSTYRNAIRRIRDYIRSGDTYQVNFSYRLKGDFPVDPWDIFQGMIRSQGDCYAAYIQAGDWVVCSASPELFFRLDGEKLISRPMKGTVTRGLWYEDDRLKSAWLQNSEKNRAENLMIVDMVRNDLGRIAEQGSVQVSSLFALEKYPTLWQLTSTVECQTRASLIEIFRALFPPASITGAPKPRTMQIIAELEDTPRRLYTGCAGYMAPGRRAQFNVAIRTLLLNRTTQTAEYGVGGGIVWDSEEESELGECRTKARILSETTPEFSLLETILWTSEEGFFLLDRHIKRLWESADYFSYPFDEQALLQKLTDLAMDLPPIPQKIRVLLPCNGIPILEKYPLKGKVTPARVGLAPSPIDSNNRFLYHKTTCREPYEQALKNCPGFDDVLLWNEKGEITESCFANVVVELNGERLTPPVECGLLAGTFRSLLLEQGEIREEIIRVRDLDSCNAFFLMNSVRKRWAVELDAIGG